MEKEIIRDGAFRIITKPHGKATNLLWYCVQTNEDGDWETFNKASLNPARKKDVSDFVSSWSSRFPEKNELLDLRKAAAK